MQKQLKKLAYTIALLTTCMTCANAAFYVGPSLSMLDNTSPNGGYRGLQPRINIGYNEMVSSCTYMALEIFASPGSILLNDNTPTGDSLKSGYSYGAGFIPGYLITDNVIGYLRLGVLEMNFSSPNDTQSGGQVGLGLQTALTQNWNLRTEYDYSAFSRANSIGAVKIDQFMLGLIYNFI